MTLSIHSQSLRAHGTAQPKSIWSAIAKMMQVRRQRQHLLQLDDHMLADIGISRSEATAEGRVALWNVPNHWRI